MKYFTPGPAQMYPTVAQHIQNALAEGFCSISHRSKHYETIHQATVENVRALLDIPNDYQMFFLNSATEAWNRVVENLVQQHSFHFVNGAFSRRFHEIAGELGRTAYCHEAAIGMGFPNITDITIPAETELIAITHNETSTGVMIPKEDIDAMRAKYPGKLIAIDAVSSVPYGNIDYKNIDTAFFSVQKGFGMPAGLCVWVVNERCLAKAEVLKNKGHHNMISLLSKARVNQTPETPNMLGIYLLGRIAGDMLRKGISQIRRETEEKAMLLYDFIAQTSGYEIFVKEESHRSNTVIVANTPIPSPEINKALAPFGMVVGTGYGTLKEQQVRIANFPAVSVGDVQDLIAALKRI